MRPATDTLNLIRLLDGALAVGEGAELREQLAGDESLRREWRRVHTLLAVPLSADDGNDIDVFSGAEQIAALVEDSDPETANIEDTQVQELASLDRWRRASDFDGVDVPAVVRNRMAGVVLRHVRPARSVRRTKEPEVITAPQTSAPASVKRPIRRSRKKDQRRLVLVATAVAGVVLVAFITWRVMWNPGASQRPEIDDVAEGTIDQSDAAPSVTDAPTDPAVDDDPPLPEPETNAEPSPIVHQSPAEAIDVEEQPLPAPPMESPLIARRETIEWQQVVGVVVESDDDENWSGVFATAKPAIPQSTSNATTYRSLQQSWGQGVTASGIEFIIGAETTAAIAAEVATLQTVSVQIERGLLAVGGLAHDAVVRCESPALAIDVRSMRDGSRIAFILSGPTPGLLVLEGEVTVGELIATAPTGVELSLADQPRLTSTVRPLEWLTPPRALAEQDWLNSCLAETDVVSALLRVDGIQSDRTLVVAADWSVALDAARAIPLAAASSASIHREAALMWLTDAQTDADRRTAVLSGLRPLLAETELGVAHWFEIARGEADVTPEVLHELALGVGRGAPLFVRHAAIRFLREATGQRFAAYDPESPTPAAVAEIRTFVRQLTQPGSRQQRGRQ